MRSSIVAIAIAFAFPSATLAQTPPPTSANVGRYQIVHSPHIEADTTLLDTATGRTWRLTKFDDKIDEPEAWVPLPRLDTPADWAAFRRDNPPKPTGAPAP